jgi:polyisoprenoid-binding protein YceI
MLTWLTRMGTAALTLAAMPLAVRATAVYAIDSHLSHVQLHVGKTGLFSFAGHTHNIVARVAEGRVEIDRGDLARSSVHVAFDASALRVTGAGESAKDVPEVQRTLDSDRVLDVSTFPRITFESQRVDVLERDGRRVRVRVRGDLTLHGVTRPETADVTVTIDEARVTANGAFTVRQTDYGIQPVTAGLGTVRVKDEVEITFAFVATRGKD